jgi:hypothetical protein
MTINIDQPANREIILYLLATRSVHERAWKTGKRFDPAFVSEGEMELGDLRTHPDLGSQLSAAARELSGAIHGYVLGYDVLVNTHGVIFAVAMGMLFMAFRLGPHDPDKLFEADEVGKVGLSSEWSPNPLVPMPKCCAEALARADALSQTKGGS